MIFLIGGKTTENAFDYFVVPGHEFQAEPTGSLLL